MKKLIVLLVVLLLLALTVQVAFAEPTKPPPNPNGGSCNMDNAWWDATGAVYEPEGPDYGPGNVEVLSDIENKHGKKVLNERGMYNVHLGTNPHHGQQGPEDWYPNGATNMDLVTTAQCGG